MLTERQYRDEYIKYVRGVMDEYAIKQVELAKAAELTETTISRYLNGLRKPTAYNAYKIDYALNRLKELREKQRNATDDEWDVFFLDFDKKGGIDDDIFG